MSMIFPVVRNQGCIKLRWVHVGLDLGVFFGLTFQMGLIW